MTGFTDLFSLVETISDREPITLHSERCLNGRFRVLDCTLCADPCPAEGAITAQVAATGSKWLRSIDMQDCLQLLHFHLGSQIGSIRHLKSACIRAFFSASSQATISTRGRMTWRTRSRLKSMTSAKSRP